MAQVNKEAENELVKEGKSKHKPKPSEALKNLLENEHIPATVKESLKDVDFDSEFDTFKVANVIMKAVEPIMSSELERSYQTVDPFDKLLSPLEDASGGEFVQIKFCLDALKTFAFELNNLYEILQLKFKKPLIKCVLCNNLPVELRNKASLICERIMEKTKYLEDDFETGNEKWISVYFWVVKCALLEKATRSDIKRVWAMHKLLRCYIVTETSQVIDTLKATIVSPNFLQHKEGRQHIAYLLALNKNLVIPFHVKIKDSLPLLVEKSKAIACFYGEVFNMAWNYADPEVRELLEEEIFQRWMELYLKLDRPHRFTQGIIGRTIFRILSHLHNSRRLLQFSSAITRLYEPILWRSLKSHHHFERCNAADLFLDAFPLEKPESNIVQNSNFLEKQFDHIMALLKDESHITRIVAIKGMIPIFKSRIECLSNIHCREILSWLANDLANDGSSYLVRTAVWDFFSSLVASDDPPEFLITLLPQTTDHFHDSCEQVRKAFSNILLNISKSNNLGISFTDVVPRAHIIARLSMESEPVGKLLSKLLMNSIYTEGMAVSEFIKRLKRLILQCPKAAINLFRWSANNLLIKDVHFIIMSILVYLRQFTKQRVQNRPDGSGKPTFQTDNKGEEEKSETLEGLDAGADPAQKYVENLENNPLLANNNLQKSPSASPVKKKRKKEKGNAQKETNATDEEETFDIDGPTAELHTHMLQCAHTMWVVFSKQLESNKTMVSELNQVLSVCLQSYLRCYKGTPAWYAALSLASLVPLTKLSDNTTASSSCLAELRRTESDTPVSITEALIYTLTAWNRGFEIIELAIDYMDPAFKLFKLNSSVFVHVPEGRRRGRVVRFVKDTGKEMIGLRLLTLLFSDYHNDIRILKNYERVHELFSYLEGIKVIIEARFGEGLNEESSAMLTDTFIKQCFNIFLDLILILDRPEPGQDLSAPSFVSTQQMIDIIKWAIKILLPHLKEMEITDDDFENRLETNDSPESTDKTTKSKKKRRQKKIIKETVQDDLALSCIKAILQETTFMINTKMTDCAHLVSSADFALLLIKSEGKYWLIEDCLDLVTAITEHTIAWCPTDEDKFLSVICSSVYSHILLPLTTNINLSLDFLRKYNCDLSSIKRKILVFPNTLLVQYGSSDEKFIHLFSNIISSCVAAVQSAAVKNDGIYPVDNIEDLSLGVSIITQAILSRPKLLPLILPTLLQCVRDNLQDQIHVLCCVSYLYTILESNRSKFDRIEMVHTVQSLYQIVQMLSRASIIPQPDGVEENDASKDDSFFLEPLAHIDACKTGLELMQKIADSANCQLVRPPSSVPAPVVRQSLL